MSIIHDALKKAQVRSDITGDTAYYVEDSSAALSSKIFSYRVKVILSVCIFLTMAGIAILFALRSGVLIGAWKGSTLSEPVVSGVAPMQKNVTAAPPINEAVEAARQRNRKGIELFEHGNLQAARGEFIAAITAFPEYAEAYNNLGLVYKKMGDAKNSEDNYKKAIAYRPRYPEAINNYGTLLDSEGRSEEARGFYKKAISISADYPAPYLNMAVSLEKDRRNDDATMYYEGYLSHISAEEEASLARAVKERLLFLKMDRINSYR